MAPVSRQEVNFARLLGQCERLVSEAQQNGGKIEWRVEKYVEALHSQLQDLNRAPSKPSDDVMKEYKRKVDFLSGVIKTEKLSTTTARVRASQRLIPVAGNISDTVHRNARHGSDITKEVHLQTKSRYHKDLRTELLGSDPHSSSSGIKKRRGHTDSEDISTKESIDDIIRHHHEAQEKVAEEMIKMAQSMKHNSIVASDIIRKDNEILKQTTRLAEANFGKLKTESDRLEEMNKRKCSWWIWIMLLIVCIVFLWMIIFIKLFPKRSK